MYYPELTDAFFEERGLIRQQIDSYNKFLEKIPEIVQEIGVIETNIEGYHIELGNAWLGKPVFIEADGSYRGENDPLYPMEARIRGLTYAAPLYIEMTPVLGGIARATCRVYSGQVPVMVKSDLCYLKNLSAEELIKIGEDPYDPGGYFIINGSERVLVSVEDLAPNRVLVSWEESSGQKVATAKIFSVRHGFRARLMIERLPSGIMRVYFPASPPNLNLFIVLKALGLEKDQEIVDAFWNKDVRIRNDVLLNLEQINVKTTEEAIDYLGRRVAMGQPREVRERQVAIMLDRYILPHMGVDPVDRLAKAYALVEMAQKAIELAYGMRDEDDKDHYANKRVKLAGELMEELFRYALRYLVRDIQYQAERAYVRRKKSLLKIESFVRPDAFTTRIKYSMATGNWPGGRTGVSQLLDRTNYVATFSHLRRVISPLSKRHPHFEARDLHATHWGKLCAIESPEGQNCGLVKNYALMVKMTTGVSEKQVYDVLASLGVSLRR